MHNNSSSPPDDRRALVLGGGGSAGNAWLIGVVAGLAAAGLDVTNADLIVGTSAGATAAAMITSASPAALYEATVSTALPTSSPTVAGVGGRVSEEMTRTQRIIDSATDVGDMRRRMGAAAIEVDELSGGEDSPRWRRIVARRLPSSQWPRQSIVLTAVDAGSGEPVAFDRRTGLSLADAVAASCSSGHAFRIGDRAYIDGGYRANADNADLAAGYGRIMVLSPFGGASRLPASWHVDLGSQVAELRAAGSHVDTLFPDADSRKLIAANAMDPASRPPAARAGFAQGRVAAIQLAKVWS